MKAFVEAYGCTLNFGESREIEDLLVSKGWDLVDDPSESDLVVLATCVVIETTERAMLKRIKELSGVKRLLITGCMATACREKAERVAHGVEFFSPGDLESFSGLIDSFDGRGREVLRDSYGIVPIATGCKGSCSYCITRLARGELRSRPQSRIIDAVRRAASDGPREIQITAQDTAAYGSDIKSDLPTLIGRICREPLDFRLRIGMMNPRSALPISDKIAEMYLERKVFKFLHLPIQSASDGVLDDMERGYSVDDFKSVVDRIHEKTPRITLSTDLIVGYPGESATDHSLNLAFITELKPDIVNVTRFSARPGTKAADAKGQIVGWMAKDRSREITELRFKVALERNRAWIGERSNALSTERGKKRGTILRNDEYKQIVVPESLPLGEFYEIEITGATATYLTGSRVGR